MLALIGAAPTGGDVIQALAVLGASLLITAAVVYAWLRHLPNSNRFGGLFLRSGMAQSDGLHLGAAAGGSGRAGRRRASPISGPPAPRSSTASGWTWSPKAST